MIEKAVVAQLTTDATVTGIVGTNIFPQPAPEDPKTFPRIIYVTDDLEPQRNFTAKSGLNKQTVTISCQTIDDPATLDALVTAVYNLFESKDGTWGGIPVQGAFLSGGPRNQRYSVPDWGPDFVVSESELDFEIWHEDVA